MLSTAKSKPPRKRTTPNTRYQLKNETLCLELNPSSRPDAQILAARTGHTATKIPNAMPTMLNSRFIPVANLGSWFFGDIGKETDSLPRHCSKPLAAGSSNRAMAGKTSPFLSFGTHRVLQGLKYFKRNVKA